MPELVFESVADWKSETECDLISREKKLLPLALRRSLVGKKVSVFPRRFSRLFWLPV
jgi:hypothetical protein